MKISNKDIFSKTKPKIFKKHKLSYKISNYLRKKLKINKK